jgi:hypothetical protein
MEAMSRVIGGDGDVCRLVARKLYVGVLMMACTSRIDIEKVDRLCAWWGAVM